MTPLYPYIFRAFYDWLLDCQANPRLMVDASLPNVQVPREYVTRDKILISIHPKFISDLTIASSTISFYTKFNGKKEFVIIPYYAMTELVCCDVGITIPLSMWMTSIEVAAHPGGIEGILSAEDGELMVQSTILSAIDAAEKELSNAGSKVSFAEVEATYDRPAESAVLRKQSSVAKTKNRPSFSLV